MTNIVFTITYLTKLAVLYPCCSNNLPLRIFVNVCFFEIGKIVPQIENNESIILVGFNPLNTRIKKNLELPYLPQKRKSVNTRIIGKCLLNLLMISETQKFFIQITIFV